MHPRLLALLLAAPLTALAGPAAAVTIGWVTVGDPGNAADTGSHCVAFNCGSVGYTYQVSKYEVTNAQYAEFLNLKAAADPLALYHTNMGNDAQGGITRSGISGFYTYAVKTGFANKPVNFVSFYDSLRFTNWLNNGQGSADTETGAYTITALGITNNTITRNLGASIFLTSGNEWYKAAFFNGTTFLDYPAGTNTTTLCAAPGATPNTANCDAPGTDATDVDVDGVTNVGAYTGSASPYGTFDQGGNVFEWNEQILSGSSRGLRGGGWANNTSIAASSPGSGTPSFEGATIGFRVASVPTGWVPEPATGLLVMAGLLGLVVRRRLSP